MKKSTNNVCEKINELLPFLQFYDSDNHCYLTVIKSEGFSLTTKGINKEGKDCCTLYLKKEKFQ